MHKRFLIFSFLALVFIACQDNSFYYGSKTTPGFWHKDSIVKLKFKAPDTIKNYNLFIHIKNTTDYQFNNLFLITSMRFPYGKVVVDTLEYKMAFKDGKLMGEGFGSLKHNKLWYKENLKFKEQGQYQIKIKQAMRKANETQTLTKLDGIDEIGFSYELVNPEKS